jgi:hypothetical protein
MTGSPTTCEPDKTRATTAGGYLPRHVSAGIGGLEAAMHHPPQYASPRINVK